MNSASQGKLHADSKMVSGLSTEQLRNRLRCDECWVTDAWLLELIKHGVLELDCADGTLFSEKQVKKAFTSAVLQRELSINPPGIALALQLLDKVVTLESRVTDLKILLAWSADPDPSCYYH